MRRKLLKPAIDDLAQIRKLLYTNIAYVYGPHAWPKEFSKVWTPFCEALNKMEEHFQKFKKD